MQTPSSLLPFKWILKDSRLNISPFRNVLVCVRFRSDADKEKAVVSAASNLRIMINVSEITSTAPEKFESPLQMKIYETLRALNIPFERVSNSPSHTMQDAVAINEKLGGKMAKNLLLTNRQKNKFWLLVMAGDKPFVTRDFSGSLGIPRVSFADEQLLQELLGVERGATNILCTLTHSPSAFTLVVDREVTLQEDFMLPDGTVTNHLKLKTSDIFDRLIPATGHDPIIIDL